MSVLTASRNEAKYSKRTRIARCYSTPVTVESPVSRPLCLGLVLAGALGAVLVPDPRTSSFLAGFGAGTGVLFVLSFLRNRRPPFPGAEDGRESPEHGEDTGR